MVFKNGRNCFFLDSPCRIHCQILPSLEGFKEIHVTTDTAAGTWTIAQFPIKQEQKEDEVIDRVHEFLTLAFISKARVKFEDLLSFIEK